MAASTRTSRDLEPGGDEDGGPGGDGGNLSDHLMDEFQKFKANNELTMKLSSAEKKAKQLEACLKKEEQKVEQFKQEEEHLTQLVVLKKQEKK
ncbi:unnamed protein product [Urochloa humidicola]